MKLKNYLKRKTAPISGAERDQIKSLLNKGMSSEDIATKLKLVPTQVAAVKAHETMKTYTGKSQVPVTDQAKKGVKQRAIAFLKSGKTTEWVAEKLGLRRIQVAALKAHVTMGTY